MWEQCRLFRAWDPGARRLFFALWRFLRSSECHGMLAVTRKRWTGCLHACKASAPAIPAHPSILGKEPAEWLHRGTPRSASRSTCVEESLALGSLAARPTEYRSAESVRRSAPGLGGLSGASSPADRRNNHEQFLGMLCQDGSAFNKLPLGRILNRRSFSWPRVLNYPRRRASRLLHPLSTVARQAKEPADDLAGQLG